MAERSLVVDHLKFSYEGLFNPAELYNVISSYFYEKGWDWYEKTSQEQVTSTGKQIRLVLEPWKGASDYYTLVIRIKINMTDLKEVDVESNGETLRLHHGMVKIIFDAYVLSDRHGEWTSSPLLWIMTILSQKYLFRKHYEKMETWVKSDLEDLHQKIKNYLNVSKYTYQG